MSVAKKCQLDIDEIKIQEYNIRVLIVCCCRLVDES